MTAISYDKIKIISKWEIQTISTLRINKTINHHAELQLRVLITENSGKKAGLQETAGEPIQIYIEDGPAKKWLFKGRLQEMKVSINAGIYIITASFLSETSQLDSQEKSRSFQNIKLTYDQIVTQILRDYPGKSFELTAPKTQINGPLIQYQETDWKFINRVASYLETVIVPDVTANERIFSFGYPTGKAKTLPDDISYSTGKNIKAYYAAKAYNPSIPENQFAYYEVESFGEFNIGDQVTFGDQEMYVGSVIIEIKQGLLVYTATLVKQITLRQNPIYNKKMTGVSLEGAVLDLQNQEVKLHLTIDKEQNIDEAYWYPFAPCTTDFMYLMPQIGTIVCLYIPGLKEQNAIITGSKRTNGQECKQTSDPNTRYIATEYGQELKLAPGGIYFTAGHSNLKIDIDDQQGVTLSSHKKMLLEAEEEITLKCANKISFGASSQILFATPTTCISMENEMHFHAPKVQTKCTDQTAFSPVEQPKPEEKSQADQMIEAKKAKPGINWGAIAAAAVATVAVVAFVAVSVATFGAGAVVGAALVGAAVGAVGGLAFTAAGDICKGEFSGVGKYLENMAKGAFLCAVTGAIWGPGIAASSGLTWWIGNAAAGGFISWADGMFYNGGNVTLEDMGKGAAIALLFAGAFRAVEYAPKAWNNAKPYLADETGSVRLGPEEPVGARYGNGERKISDELYNKLRKNTPSEEVRDIVNEGIDFPIPDPALPGKTVTSRLEADHIVPMDKITRMDGFNQLTYEQQLEVLNNQNNFVGLSKTANTSKGSKSYEEWTTYKKENIEVDPEFRTRMIEKSSEMEGNLQRQIDDLVKKE